MAESWMWCLEHNRTERTGEACGAERRLGPYPTEEAAKAWKERSESRNDTWDAEDERWEGRAER